MFRRRESIEVKSLDEILLMRQAGKVVANALEACQKSAVEGVTTSALDEIARSVIREAGATPSFLEVPGYQHALCVSVNEEVVHGLPGQRRLVDGDLVSIDCGAVLDGWHGDAAVSFVVGGADAARPHDLHLIEATQRALWAGIAAFVPGASLNDVGGAIEDEIEQAASVEPRTSLGIVEGYTGHGIGRQMHMPPDVYNYRITGRTPKVKAGATIAIEPMVTLGSTDTRVLPDGWTVVSVDGSRAAHWEHTVAATERGVWVLTAADGGRSKLAAFGDVYGGLDD